MKKCTRCGAVNGDSYTECIECGAPFEPHKSDYFYVSKSDRVVAASLVIGALVNLLLMRRIESTYMADYWVVNLLAIILMVIEGISILLPKLTWSLYRLRLSADLTKTRHLKPSETDIHIRRGIAYFTVIVGYALIVLMVIELYF